MPLRQRQLDALSVLEWLNDPTVRSSGRTVAMAIAAIRTACRNPGVFIDIVDHARPAQARDNLVQIIRDMARADFRLEPYFALGPSMGTAAQFRLVLPNPIPDWMPTEAVLSGRAAIEQGRAAGARLADSFGVSQRDMAAIMRPRRDEVMDEDQMTDMISPEVEARFAAAEARQAVAARNRLMAELIPTEVSPEAKLAPPAVVKKPKAPPQPKSAWDRLLADKD